MRKRIIRMLTALATGAATMFFFDKDEGNRRRALVRDKVKKVWNDTTDKVEGLTEDVKNRLQGARAEAKNRFSTILVSDETLTARIRSMMGHVTDNAQAVDVKVENGHVTLSGVLPKDDIDKLVHKVESMAGVERVYNLIDIPQPNETIGSHIERG